MTTSSEKRLLHEGVNNVRGEITEKEIQRDPKNARAHLEKMFLGLPESTQKTLSVLPVEKDEEEALRTLETLLKEDEISFKALQEIFWTLLNFPYGFRTRTKEEHIANLTVSFLREEISVLPLVIGSSTPRRGLDVVRIKIAKSSQGKSGFGRIQLDNQQILMEMQDNLLADQNSRPRNYLTETVSRSIDEGESDLEILKATAKRGIIEEALLPLSEGDSSITNEQREELAEWLLQGVSFRTQSGQDVQSGSTQVKSHYRLHTVHIDVPHPQGDSVPPKLKTLLQKLRNSKAIKRENEGNTLVWSPTSLLIQPVRAPVYCHSRDDAKRMEEMQKTREGDLQIIPESDDTGLDLRVSGSSGMKDQSEKKDWLDLVPTKYNVNRQAENLEVAMEAHIHNFHEVKSQIRRKGRNPETRPIGTGPGKLDAVVKTTISVMRAVADYDCSVCKAKKGQTCTGDESEHATDNYNFSGSEPNYARERDPETGKLKVNYVKKYTFKVHRSRLLDYKGNRKTGTSKLWKDLSRNRRYQESRLDTIDLNEKIEPTTVESGAKLHQITPNRRSGKITLEPVKQKKNGKPEEVVAEYNPKSGNANSSTVGWWHQVHIDQSTEQMRKIANALQETGFNFVLLCCSKDGDPSNKALGIISVLDLTRLANLLD